MWLIQLLSVEWGRERTNVENLQWKKLPKMVRRSKKRCGDLPKVRTPLVHSPVNRRKEVPRNMRRWVLVKENPVFKVWTLFLLQWGGKVWTTSSGSRSGHYKAVEAFFWLARVIGKDGRDGSRDAMGTSRWNVQQGWRVGQSSGGSKCYLRSLSTGEDRWEAKGGWLLFGLLSPAGHGQRGEQWSTADHS